jgi:hypothetical protein
MALPFRQRQDDSQPRIDTFVNLILTWPIPVNFKAILGRATHLKDRAKIASLRIFAAVIDFRLRTTVARAQSFFTLPLQGRVAHP